MYLHLSNKIDACADYLFRQLKRPALVRQTPTSRLFFRQDSTWLVPRASAFFDLHSYVSSNNYFCTAFLTVFIRPIADVSPLAAIKTQLFASLVEESLADQTYDASLAGLDFSVGSDQIGRASCRERVS